MRRERERQGGRLLKSHFSETKNILNCSKWRLRQRILRAGPNVRNLELRILSTLKGKMLWALPHKRLCKVGNKENIMKHNG